MAFLLYYYLTTLHCAVGLRDTFLLTLFADLRVILSCIRFMDSLDRDNNMSYGH